MLCFAFGIWNRSYAASFLSCLSRKSITSAVGDPYFMTCLHWQRETKHKWEKKLWLSSGNARGRFHPLGSCSWSHVPMALHCCGLNIPHLTLAMKHLYKDQDMKAPPSGTISFYFKRGFLQPLSSLSFCVRPRWDTARRPSYQGQMLLPWSWTSSFLTNER